MKWFVSVDCSVSLSTFFICIWSVLPLSCTTSTHIVATFLDHESPNSSTNNHVAVHKVTGVLFVGAVNHIYQLDSNLKLMSRNKAGPFEDSTLCSSNGECPENTHFQLTNNVNKALVIDYIRAQLIICGSLFQGICWTSGLDDVSTTKLEVVSGPIVANNEDASTVAFIAPGPHDPPTSMVLYVGVTYTGNSPYRHSVPAVSSRSLNPGEKFGIVSTGDGVSPGTKMAIRMRQQYPINYIYGFSSEGFSYFLTTQRMDPSPFAPIISKLIRVCQNDSDYYSYTEIPIECTSETSGIKYDLVQAAYIGNPGRELANKLNITYSDDVLFAVFSTASSAGNTRGSPESALCVYSLKDIRRKFVENIEPCFQGNGNLGLGFITTNPPCITTKMGVIPEDFCGMDVNTPLGGAKPVVAVSVLNYTSLLTSVAATSVGDYTVVFLGTNDGHLKKVYLESANAGSQYDDIIIDPGRKVNVDLFFDPQKSHIYVMTDQKISKVLVQNCSEYNTCHDCVEAGDPYCGWCWLQYKCTLKADCTNTNDLAYNWISFKSGQCTRITGIEPGQLQISTSRTLFLSVEHLPLRSGHFLCGFRFRGGKELRTNANLTYNGVLCYSPPTFDIPPIPGGQHHFTAELSVRMVQDGTMLNNFATTEFVFFDCNSYTSCTSCVNSTFVCDWCIDKHRCTHDTAENCRNDILVTSVSRIGPSIRTGPGFCPRITVPTGPLELLVPHGQTKKIQVKVENIAYPLLVQPRFSCVFNIEGRVSLANAQILDNTIDCDPFPFSYNSFAANVSVSFAVVVPGPRPLDNPDNFRILVYRCSSMADNCGMCLTLDLKYRCGWCQSLNKCEVREQCEQGQGVWLNQNENCPNPEITSFTPKSGVREGGTNITISGINLGKTFEDIYVGITVAGVSCDPYPELYVKTTQIVCLLDIPQINQAMKGPILVQVANFRAQSADTYKFVNPKIYQIEPGRGPIAGGTQLTIFGEHLNAGNQLQVIIGNVPCNIISKQTNQIKCRTGGANRIGRADVIIKFDQKNRSYLTGFTYMENPIIRIQTDEPIRSILAGGINVTIKGSNFDVVQEPYIFIIYNNTKYTNACDIWDSETIFCLTPKLENEPDFQGARDGYIDLQYGFILDTIYHNVTEQKFHLYPNPHYDQFEEVQEHKADYLTISGIDLFSAIDDTKVIVTIGNSPCNVTAVSMHQLICKPPKDEPLNFNENGFINTSQPPMVKVKVGTNWEIEIGRLKYDQTSVGELLET